MLRRTSAQLLGTSFGATHLPPITNEACRNFVPDSQESIDLQAACKAARAETFKIPIVINGERLYPGAAKKTVIPSENKTTFAEYHVADNELMAKAVASCLRAHKEWSRVPFQDRAAIFLAAANKLATTHRYDIQSTTMIGQSKTPWQAEIDSVTESIDFLRFHAKFAAEMYEVQPVSPPATNVWNMTEYRPLEGFVAAISPFNFTAIGANLAATPAMLGNTVLWKPSPGAVVSNYRVFCLLEECGLPKGVINYVPAEIDETARMLRHPDLAGCAFTGSTAAFQSIWQNVAGNLPAYRNFPRVSGETGGKNFHLVHPSAHIPTVVACTARSAFEYQGQKCSACSRAFFPASRWEEIKAGLQAVHADIKQGQPDDWSSFMSAVIDETSFNKNKRYLDIAKEEGLEVVAGGKADSSKGWFIQPTILRANALSNTTLKEEIFGPIVTVWVYDDSKPNFWGDICDVVDKGADYGLTGSIFSRDREALRSAQDALRYASGMLYVNDKSTGAVVGQQPFGGARRSGTNDKPGGRSFVEKWVTPRTIKEAFDYLPGVSYPHQLPDVISAK